MRRTGYFATVSGARGTGQRPLLRPPRRLFAPEAVAPGADSLRFRRETACLAPYRGCGGRFGIGCEPCVCGGTGCHEYADLKAAIEGHISY